MKIDPIYLPCGCCNGTGKRELTGKHGETYRAVAAIGREITGAKLAVAMGVMPCAMNNRLAKLEEFGLLVSRVDGRERLFRLAEDQ